MPGPPCQPSGGRARAGIGPGKLRVLQDGAASPSRLHQVSPTPAGGGSCQAPWRLARAGLASVTRDHLGDVSSPAVRTTTAFAVQESSSDQSIGVVQCGPLTLVAAESHRSNSAPREHAGAATAGPPDEASWLGPPRRVLQKGDRPVAAPSWVKPANRLQAQVIELHAPRPSGWLGELCRCCVPCRSKRPATRRPDRA